jgi:hypothetical protein
VRKNAVFVLNFVVFVEKVTKNDGFGSKCFAFSFPIKICKPHILIIKRRDLYPKCSLSATSICFFSKSSAFPERVLSSSELGHRAGICLSFQTSGHESIVRQDFIIICKSERRSWVVSLLSRQTQVSRS